MRARSHNRAKGKRIKSLDGEEKRERGNVCIKKTREAEGEE